MTLEEFITTETSMDGNTHRVITYNGEKFAEPYFTGEELGWLKEVLWEWRTQSFYCLIVTVSGHKLWLTVSLRDANKKGINQGNKGCWGKRSGQERGLKD